MVRRGTGEIKKKKGGLERVERKREISLRRGGFFFFFTRGGWNNNKALSGSSEILSIKDFTWQLLLLMF